MKVDEKIKVKWNSSTKKYYESLGYQYTKMGDEFEINAEDLTANSRIKIPLICDFCGKVFYRAKSDDTKIKEREISKEDACKNCCNLKSRRSVKEKYGVENVFELEETQEKCKQTCLNIYGAENPFASDEIKEKIKKTSLKKYGTEYPSQSDEIKEKMKITNLEKYGVENPFESEEIKAKIFKTNILKYGVKTYTQTDEYKEKTKNTCLERYGVTSPMKCPEIVNKLKGENNPKWKGGIHEPSWDRLQPKYREWRTAIFQRDRYTCLRCSRSSTYLEAHHIFNWNDNPDKRYDLENGVTLCQNCHIEFHRIYGKKNNTTCQLSEFLQPT